MDDITLDEAMRIKHLIDISEKASEDINSIVLISTCILFVYFGRYINTLMWADEEFNQALTKALSDCKRRFKIRYDEL